MKLSAFKVKSSTEHININDLRNLSDIPVYNSSELYNNPIPKEEGKNNDVLVYNTVKHSWEYGVGGGGGGGTGSTGPTGPTGPTAVLFVVNQIQP
jgi:hypothetical protein